MFLTLRLGWSSPVVEDECDGEQTAHRKPFRISCEPNDVMPSQEI